MASPLREAQEHLKREARNKGIRAEGGIFRRSPSRGGGDNRTFLQLLVGGKVVAEEPLAVVITDP